MVHDTAGDPVSGLKWTRRTTAKLAGELRRLGINVCPQTVGRLLKAMGYSLRVNHKKLRNCQMLWIGLDVIRRPPSDPPSG